AQCSHWLSGLAPKPWRARSRGSGSKPGDPAVMESPSAATRITRLEEELLPGSPPVVPARYDPAVARLLHPRLPPLAIELARVRELDLDLARPARVVRSDGLRVSERPLRRLLDELARAKRRDLTSARRADPTLHRDRGQAVTQQLPCLAADRVVAGHE